MPSKKSKVVTFRLPISYLEQLELEASTFNISKCNLTKLMVTTMIDSWKNKNAHPTETPEMKMGREQRLILVGRLIKEANKIDLPSDNDPYWQLLEEWNKLYKEIGKERATILQKYAK